MPTITATKRKKNKTPDGLLIFDARARATTAAAAATSGRRAHRPLSFRPIKVDVSLVDVAVAVDVAATAVLVVVLQFPLRVSAGDCSTKRSLPPDWVAVPSLGSRARRSLGWRRRRRVSCPQRHSL